METTPRHRGTFSWIEYGNGPVLLPIYGLLGGPSNFVPLARTFAASHRIVIPLVPMADAPAGTANVDGLVQFLVRFLEENDLTAVNLIGNSLGGQLAVLLADLVPQRVRTLTLSGSAGLGEQFGPLSLMRGDRAPSRADYELIRELALLTFHDPVHATAEVIDGIYQLLNHEPQRARNLIAIAQSSKRRNVEDVLQRLSQPVCLIWGREDRITPPATAERFLQAIPDATLKWIDACGHAPMMEQPEMFNRLLAEWLSAR